jgi:mediator of RNA polymerase II transcription subunit 4
MASALHLARRHQIKQRKIEALQEEILGLDKELREIWSELEMGTRELEDIIEEGDERLKAIEHATKGPFIFYP